jgi:membrane protease YdiL (CAAX protease family)
VREWAATLGLHTGRGIFREILAGIIGYLAGIPVLILGFIVSLLLIKMAGVTPTHPAEEAMRDGGIGILITVFVLGSIWAPISEELMFRGALFSHLRERAGWWITAPIVGLIFALVHPQGWTLVPVLGGVGFVFCGIREWRGSILACMTAHALHNTLTLLLALSVLRD